VGGVQTELFQRTGNLMTFLVFYCKFLHQVLFGWIGIIVCCIGLCEGIIHSYSSGNRVLLYSCTHGIFRNFHELLTSGLHSAVFLHLRNEYHA